MESLTNKEIILPTKWYKYHNQPGYFITYYGDIYHGYIIEHPKYHDRFFILSKNQSREFNSLKNEERTLENYQRLSWEICDPRIIKDVLDDQELGVGDFLGNTPQTESQTWKRMFVFGAGASNNCLFGPRKKQQYDSMMRPPLGNNIFDECFDEILNKYKGASLTNPIFEANNRDIEGCLEDEWRRTRNSYNPTVTKRHINLQFYLQALFVWISSDVTRKHTRNNLYSLFANKLQAFLSENDERIAITSFNYDTILDNFLEDIFGNQFNQISDYIDYTYNQVLLFKPHGSCNWGWPVTNRKGLDSTNTPLHETIYNKNIEPSELYFKILGDFNEMVYKYAWGSEASMNKNRLGRYTINKNKIELNKQPLGGTHFPALLMPYRDKDEFVMPYIHQSAMQNYMSNMEELYLIGWKGNEELFNRLLSIKANRLQKIVIVNPLEVTKKEVSQNLDKHLDLKKYKIEVVDTFEDFVIDKMDKIFT